MADDTTRSGRRRRRHRRRRADVGGVVAGLLIVVPLAILLFGFRGHHRSTVTSAAPPVTGPAGGDGGAPAGATGGGPAITDFALPPPTLTPPAAPATVSLVPGGDLAGRVTAAAGGAALRGVCVFAHDTTGSGNGQTTTTADGSWQLTDLPAGAYVVAFYPGCGVSGDYLVQYWRGTRIVAAATTVGVRVGGSTGGIDAVMALAGAITGTVTGPSGAGQQGVCVYAEGPGGYAQTVTGPGGAYRLGELGAGPYTVAFAGCGATAADAPQYYRGALAIGAATPVGVTAGATTAGIDARMATVRR